MTFIGIDVGLSGAIGVIGQDKVEVIDVPTLEVLDSKGRIRRKYEIPTIRDILRTFNGETRVALEDQQAFPDQGVSSMFALGWGLGIWEGLLGAMGISYQKVWPRIWRKVMLQGMPKGKDASRLKAQQLFPQLDLKLKKHHGRAEAILIAEFLRKTTVP